MAGLGFAMTENIVYYGRALVGGGVGVLTFTIILRGMVAPFSHWASPQEADAAALSEFWPLVLKAQRVLQKAYSPHGFNLGMNLGAPAGAGVPGHYHFHLVPRWNGDTNFMSVLAEVRLVPEDLGQARERLRALFAQEET